MHLHVQTSLVLFIKMLIFILYRYIVFKKVYNLLKQIMHSYKYN